MNSSLQGFFDVHIYEHGMCFSSSSSYFLQHTSWNIFHTPRSGLKFFLLGYEILCNDCKMQENFEYVFSLTASMASFFLQDLFWEHLHEEHNTVILHKY